ncbi:hypothetical protein B2I21_18855 [Chryseobacterium mucoviscidosis]|nr:hypothetical protein B2I21_18855 [Chryseobacterium mucoviscidosis]
MFFLKYQEALAPRLYVLILPKSSDHNPFNSTSFARVKQLVMSTSTPKRVNNNANQVVKLGIKLNVIAFRSGEKRGIIGE